MNEITVKEFLELTEGKKYNVESEDGYGVSFNMYGVAVTHEDDLGEIGFFKVGQGCEVSFKIDDCIETITQMKDGGFSFEFSLYMADVVLTEVEV